MLALYQLYLRYAFLVAGKLGDDPRIVDGHEIVHVHAGVDEAVQQAREYLMTTYKFKQHKSTSTSNYPHEHKRSSSAFTWTQDRRKVCGTNDAHMMVDVQKRYLAVLFAQHKNDRLDEVAVLVQQVQTIGENKRIGRSSATGDQWIALAQQFDGDLNCTRRKKTRFFFNTAIHFGLYTIARIHKRTGNC